MNDNGKEPGETTDQRKEDMETPVPGQSEPDEPKTDGAGRNPFSEESIARPENEEAADQDSREIWPQLRMLLVFQLKLYIDALRDLLMSPLSVVVFIIDAVQGNRGDDSLFQALLKFGRRTEKAINLFDQHDVNDENYRGVDSILMQVEEAVRKEYTDGSVSGNARESIENSLGRLRKKLKQSELDDE